MLAAGAFLTKYRTNLFAGIFGEPLVKKIADCGKIVAIVIGAVHAIIHGNETDIIAGEDQLRISPDSQIVSAKAGHILDDPRSHKTLLYKFKALLHTGTVEVRPGITIVYQYFEVCIASFVSKAEQQIFLIQNGI